MKAAQSIITQAQAIIEAHANGDPIDPEAWKHIERIAHEQQVLAALEVGE